MDQADDNSLTALLTKRAQVRFREIVNTCTERRAEKRIQRTAWILSHVLRKMLCEHVNGLCPAGWLNEQSITKHWFQSVRTCPYSWATNSCMRQNAYHLNLKCIFEYLLPCYCYATKANSRTIRLQVSQPASAGREANLVNCQLITAWHQNSEPDTCSGSVISANKLLLQELTQLIKIKMLISHFLEIFAS